MTAAEAALDRVYTLYLLQTKLWTFLDTDLRSAAAREELTEDMRAFQKLLRDADWRYMGGEDVLDSLRTLHGEVHARLKTFSSLKRAKGKVRKAVMKKVKNQRKQKRR